MRTQRRRLEPQARREEIIEAAEQLLKKHGAGVRVEDVVRAAGAAKGTFYLYFPAWDDLLETIRARLVAAFDNAHPPPAADSEETDWLALLEEFADAFIDAVADMGKLHEVLFHSDFSQRRPIPAGDHPVERLTMLVRAGREVAAFADVDPEPAARLLFAVIHETADAVTAGADRQRALAAMHHVLHRTLAPGADG